MTDREYFVYKHTSPNGKVYIGITCQSSPKKRWMGGLGYQENEHFYRAIKKYGWNNFKHEIIATGISKKDACDMEMQLISKYKSYNEKFGYNNTLGGEANVPSEHTLKKMRGKFGPLNNMFGKKMPESAKQRLREINTGRKMRQETKLKISLANKGKNTWSKGKSVSDETKKKISNKLKGRVFSDKHKIALSKKAKETHSGRKILQLTKDGIIVKEWENAKVAGRILGIKDTNIYRSIKMANDKKTYSAGGFVWKYI